MDRECYYGRQLVYEQSKTKLEYFHFSRENGENNWLKIIRYV